MRSDRFALLVLAASAATVVACAAHGTVVPDAVVNVDSTQLAVLHDLVGSSRWRDSSGHHCIDPQIVRYRSFGRRDERPRWPDRVVRSLSGIPRVAFDSTDSHAPNAIKRCRRTPELPVEAYSVPRVTGDTGAVAIVATQVDLRGNVDTFAINARLRRRRGSWMVDGIIADTAVINAYIDGRGCYRFRHAAFTGHQADSAHITGMVIRADSEFVGRSFLSQPSYRLSPSPQTVGLGAANHDDISYWYVTHDSLHLFWAATNKTLMADLRVRGNLLDGSMHFETDAAVPTPPRVDVVGRRIPCSH